jgi:thiamine-monophosphate kinase
VNEYEIIRLLTKAAGRLPDDYLPIGDDVASLNPPPGKLVLKVDMLVGRTDVPPGMTWRQAGRKAVAMCVSDFASKGVRPSAFMVSLGVPSSTGQRDLRSLVGGFQDGIKEWDVDLIGGDTNESEDLIVDCVLVGFADHPLVRRTGSRAGELVVVTGDFGTTSAGLKMLLEKASSEPGFRRRALRNVYTPSPRLALGIALRDCFSSAMDSSDGLAICLHTLGSSSHVGMKIDVLPHKKELEAFAERNGYSLKDLILYGGEEYEIVGTIPKRKFERARKIANSMKSDLIVIGETTAGGEIRTSNGDPIEKKGWIHLA